MIRFYSEIVKAATEAKLDPLLVVAVCQQESALNTDAFRFEPAFYNRYLKIAPEWEWARNKYANPRRISSSYGLMQVMYPVALEDGFSREVPPETLFIPEMGLLAGCRRLRKLTDWADKGWPGVAADLRLRAVLASYNGGRGGNTPGTALRTGKYAAEVLAKLAILKTGI